MANTTIQLKKSSTPSATPTNLANGELAINFADGKLFYKDSTGTIQEISGGGGGNSFGTVNANGTLIIADTTNDILSLKTGNNIIITGDALTDSITFEANLSPAFNKANDAYTIANAAFDKANSGGNTFSTIAVSGQTSITTSSSSDTLTFASNGGINIETNATSKTIYISQADTIDYGLITGSVTATTDYGSIA